MSKKYNFNYIDEFGLFVGKTRIVGESNKDYHARLVKGTEYNSTNQGLFNMICELFGLDLIDVKRKMVYTVSYPPLKQDEKIAIINEDVYQYPTVINNDVTYQINPGVYYGATTATVARVQIDGVDLMFADRDEITIGDITWRLWKNPVTGVYTRIFSVIQIPTITDEIPYSGTTEEFIKLSIEQQSAYDTNINPTDIIFRYEAYKDNITQIIDESGKRYTKDIHGTVITVKA